MKSKLGRRWLRRILIALVVLHLPLLAGLVYLHHHQEFLVYQPLGGVRATPDQFGARFEDVFITTEDGAILHGWYLPVERPRGTILYCHGNAGNITDRRKALEGLLALGFDVFIFDYRGFGRSTGSPTEQGTYLDVERAWKYLVEERALPPEKIVLWGRSLGGAIATHLATKVRPGALVLESTFVSLPDLTSELYWIPDRSWVKVKYPSLERIRSIDMPYLQAHSKLDNLIAYHHGLDLFEACPSPHKLFIEIGGSHRSGHLTEPQYRDRVDAFLRGVSF